MNHCGRNRFMPRLYEISNRIEHQKLNQVAAELPPGWVFGVQLGLRQIEAVIKTKTIRRGKVPTSTLLLSIKLPLFSNIASGSLPVLVVLVFNQCLYLPKAELNTKNSTRWQLCCYLVEFLVFNSIRHVIKTRLEPVRAALVHMNHNGTNRFTNFWKSINCWIFRRFL